MIQRLRRKFTFLATVALLVVIATVLIGMVGLSYSRARQDENNVLTVLSENNGQLVNKQGLANARQRLGNRFNTETMFQYRYFSVVVNDSGKVQSIVDNHIWTVQRGQIVALGRQVIKKSKSTPSIPDRILHRNPNQGRVQVNNTSYSYRVTRISPHQYLAVFLDDTALMESLQDMNQIGLLIGVVCLLLFMAILWLLSGLAVKPMVENERRQKQFITNAGHELKTPLAVISANNEMQEMMDGESEWTQSNKMQIARLTQLINHLISIAKLGENPEIHLSPIEISKKTSEVVKSFDAIAKSDNKTLQSDITPEITVNGDVRYYEELLNILLDNAVKYCDDKGIINVTLSKASKKHVQLVVSNSYAAGKNENFDQFFERFYRDDQSHHHGKKGGFGIGLSMAANLVHSFHGKIKASWKDGMIYFTVKMQEALPAKDLGPKNSD